MEGLCECGCGGMTKVARWAEKRYGYARKQHRRFINGHANRTHPRSYEVEDRGYKTPCWVWKWHTQNGYGLMGGSRDGVGSRYAHRSMYEKHRGPVPKGLELDHLCRVRACVNPEHLEPVTHFVNMRRGKSSKLSLQDIEDIVQMRREGKMMKEISARYDIHIAYCEVLCRRA